GKIVEQGRLGSMAVSPNGKRIATASALWDVETGQQLASFGAQDGPIRKLAFSPEGRSLAYTRGHRVRLLDAESCQPIDTSSATGGDLDGLAFSPDGQRLAVAAEDQAIVWDLSKRQQSFPFPVRLGSNGYGANSLALSCDGKLATPDGDQIVLL